MPAASWQPDLPNILDILGQAEVQEEWMLAAGSNYVFLLKLTHPEAGEGYAVYKPRDGEAPLHDFPAGTLYKREYAAYVVSQALGWNLVPATVVREEGLSAGVGALQLFVVHDPALHFFNLKDDRQEDMRRIALFDWLVNNADRKGGHTLLDGEGHLWCIDHGITFHAEDKLRTVIWDFQGTPVPPAMVEDVCDFAVRLREDTSLRQQLSEPLSEIELSRLEERAAMIDRERVYPPQPMHRPYPWPMI